MNANDILAGLPIGTIARRLQVSRQTARRWKRTGQVPPLAQRLLEALLGDLGAVDQAWSGFTMRGDKLITPEGVEVRPTDVQAIHWRRQQIDSLRRRLAEPQQWKLL